MYYLNTLVISCLQTLNCIKIKNIRHIAFSFYLSGFPFQIYFRPGQVLPKTLWEYFAHFFLQSGCYFCHTSNGVNQSSECIKMNINPSSSVVYPLCSTAVPMIHHQCTRLLAFLHADWIQRIKINQSTFSTEHSD